MRHGVADGEALEQLANRAQTTTTATTGKRFRHLAAVLPAIERQPDQFVEIAARQAVVGLLGSPQYFVAKGRRAVFAMTNNQGLVRQKTLHHALRPQEILMAQMHLLRGFNGHQQTFQIDSRERNQSVHEAAVSPDRGARLLGWRRAQRADFRPAPGHSAAPSKAQ